MKNILIIGGAGFIGSNLIKTFLKKEKFNIHVVEPSLASIERLKKFKSQITIHRLHIKDTIEIEQLFLQNEINIVFHLVSKLIPASDYLDYKKEIKEVVEPTSKLLDVCSHMNILFVFFSSGGTIYGKSINKKFIESDTPDPISYYGLSKLMIEKAIKKSFKSSDLNYLILRPSNPYGNGQNLFGNQGLISIIIGKILTNSTLNIWGDGSQSRDYIHIHDLCTCIYLLITKKVVNETINIASGQVFKVNEIIEFIKDLSAENLKVKYYPERKVDVKNVELSTKKLRSLVKVDKFIDIKSGILTFLKYSKENFNK